MPRTRRLIALWYLFGGILTALGLVQIVLATSGARLSHWIAAFGELAGGLVILAGAIVEHRSARRSARHPF
jgi:hypothetical protein